MQRTLRQTATILFALLPTLSSGLSAGAWGVPDAVPAATLVVPFFEVGINPATHPQNTAFSVYAAAGPVTLHYEIYTIDGVGSFSLFDNVVLEAGETWSSSFEAILAAGLPEDRAALIDGPFYRGFMTIDVVTEATVITPFEEGYPFGVSNAIIGSIYYLRLSEGSANGLPMIGLEYTSDSADPVLSDFYRNGDGREKIDDDARECSAAMTRGNVPCPLSDLSIDAIRARVFHSAPLSGNTRIVIFTWTTANPEGGGPSALCSTMGCDQVYDFQQLREDGTVVQGGLALSLPHVVNIIETVGPNPGEFTVFDIPDPNESMQTYAFSINSASPEGNPNINWDAIFEAWVQAEPLDL